MSIHTLVASTLAPILANSWAVELPPSPAWPAMVFEIDTTPELNWVFGARYEQHTLQVLILAETPDAIDPLLSTVLNTFEQLPQYLCEEGRGDAEYEPNPRIYGRFLTLRLRTRET